MTTNQGPTTGERWLAFAPVAIITLFAFITIHYYQRAEEGRLLVRHTDEVLARTVLALYYLQEAETGQRGYLLTGDTSHLITFHSGRDSSGLALTRLQNLTRDNPEQQKLIADLRPIVAHRLARLDSSVALQLAGHSDNSLQVVRSSTGRELMDSARTIFRAIRREEIKLLREREERGAYAEKRMKVVLLVGVLAAALLSYLVTARFYNRAMRHWLVRAELSSRIEMLKSQGEELERVNQQLRDQRPSTPNAGSPNVSG